MNFKNWKYYIKFYKSYKSKLIIIGIISTILSFAMLPIAYAVRTIFDKSIPQGNRNELIVLGIIIIILQMVNSSLLSFIRYMTLEITKSVITILRKEMVEKFYSLSNLYYSRVNIAKLHTVIVQDTERLDIMSNALIAIILPAILINLILIPVLIFLNGTLFFILLGVLPVSILIIKLMGRKVRKRISAFHRAFEVFSKGMLFVLRAVDLTKIQAAENLERERQAKYADDLKIKSLKMAWLTNGYKLIQEGVMSLVNIIIIVIGGIAVINGSMSLGDVISFFTVLLFMHKHILAINGNIPRIIEGNESLKSLVNFLQEDQTQLYNGIRKIEFTGRIQLKNIRFGYSKKEILKNVNLELLTGNIITILGPNGSGKSTLINLILGLYSPWEGSILADGISYKDLDISDLLHSFGVVRQNPILFDGTIRENICYGYPQVKESDLIRAAELALARGFIEEFPKKFDTKIGKEGELLSGGQRQCIAITRALLNNPRLLILDEPTTHLDKEIIIKLTNSLKKDVVNRSILIITHEHLLVEISKKVYNLVDGILIEQ